MAKARKEKIAEQKPIEQTLWLAAYKMWKNVDTVVYKSVPAFMESFILQL